MGLSALNTKIKRFYDLNTQRKALEKEEDALKAWFKDEAGLTDVEFKYRDLVVSVSTEDRTSIDTGALRLSLGDGIKEFEKTTPCKKVSVRKIAKEKAA